MPRCAAPAEALQLSLFDVPAPLAAPEAVSAVPRAPTPHPAPALEPAAPARESVAAVFRHPRADREIRLREHLVAYELRRARRRSIGFVVGADGLAVSAPRWVGHAATSRRRCGRRPTGSCASWPSSRSAHSACRRKVDWRDGATLPFLGETVIVVLDAAPPTGAVLNTDAQSLPGVPRLTLHVGLPHTRHAGADPRRGAKLAAAPGASACSRSGCAHFARQAGRALHAAVAVVGADALGQRQRRRLDPAELAPGPLRA